MLNDLFRKLRQKEPTRILVLRRLVIFVSLSLLIAFFVISCIGVYNELPSINTTFRTVDSLPVPGIKMIFSQVKKKKIKLLHSLTSNPQINKCRYFLFLG